MVDALLEFIKGKREISATKFSTALSLLKKIVPGQTMGLAIAIRTGGLAIPAVGLNAGQAA
jgi:hypothetical protein